MTEKFSASRRKFIQNAALVAASASLPSIAEKVFAQSAPTPVDALIIGTGFGAAVAALRLSQLGITTVMLERGRRWAKDANGEYDFATFRNPDRRSGWMRTDSPIKGFGFGTGAGGADVNPITKYAGIFERIDHEPTVINGVHKVKGNGIIVIGGAGVGGGSLIYNAISYQPTKENFYKVFPQAINYDEMASKYYPLVRSITKPAATPPDILNTDYYRATRAMLELGQLSGLPTRLLELDVNWDKVREELNGTRTKSAIIGDTWFGIKSGAKNSLDQNYLKMAEDSGKVTINPLHIVYSIEENTGGKGYIVRCKQIDETGNVVADKAYSCRILVVAAGSVGTSALFVKAKAKGTLPKLNAYVGQGWHGNGDALGIPIGLPATNINNLGQGGPAGATIEHFTNPIAPISITSLAKWNAQNEILGIAMAIPPATKRGNFTYNSITDTVTLNFPLSANAEVVKSLSYTLDVIKTKAVNYFIQKPPYSVVIGTTTGHPLGGMVMGQACDLDGRVKGYSGLYVVDGALIPGSTACTNPSLTIAAIAERCLDRLKTELPNVNK
jgi:cholesterol oxidase